MAPISSVRSKPVIVNKPIEPNTTKEGGLTAQQEAQKALQTTTAKTPSSKPEVTNNAVKPEVEVAKDSFEGGQTAASASGKVSSTDGKPSAEGNVKPSGNLEANAEGKTDSSVGSKPGTKSKFGSTTYTSNKSIEHDTKTGETTKSAKTTTETTPGPKTEVTNNGFKPTTDVVLAEDSFEKEKVGAEASGTVSSKDGNFSAEGSAKAGTAGVDGEGSVTMDLANGTATASGNLGVHTNVASVEGKVTAETPLGTTEASAEASLGAEASLNGEVVIDPLKGEVGAEVGGEAFVGVKAEANVEHTVGPVTAEAEVSANAGLGGTFEADVGLEDGKLSAEFEVGATLGIGGEVSFGVEVDVGEMVDTVKDGFKDAGEGIKKVFSGW